MDKEDSALESHLEAFSLHVNKITRKGMSDWKKKMGREVGADRVWKRKERGWDIARVQLQTAPRVWGSGDKSQLLKFLTGHMTHDDGHSSYTIWAVSI